MCSYFFQNSNPSPPEKPIRLLEKVREMTLDRSINSLIGQIMSTPKYFFLYMEQLFKQYSRGAAVPTLEGFEAMIAPILTNEVVGNVEQDTCDQAVNQQWLNLRFGRIPASILYEISRCNTRRGKTLVHFCWINVY